MVLSASRALRSVVVVLSLGLAGAACADQSSSGAAWACWYSPKDLTVRCALTQAPREGRAERAAAAEKAHDDKLPELAKVIDGSPERLAGRQISIPLWSVPFEMEYVQMLAESVMCRGRPDCKVAFDANEDGLADRRAAGAAYAVARDELEANKLASAAY